MAVGTLTLKTLNGLVGNKKGSSKMVQNVGFFERIKRGWHIAMTGWSFIWQNPSCLLFPLISLIVQALIFIPLLAYAMIYALKNRAENIHLKEMHLPIEHTPIPPSVYVFYAITLFLAGLTMSIMYTALSHYIAQKLENRPASVFSSLGVALSRFTTLFVWTFINVSLTLIFNWIREKARKGTFPFNLIAGLVANILQFAWQFLTFFVYPIFALTNFGAIDSIKESGQTVKKMWGEQIGATFNIGFIAFLAILALGIIVWPLAFMFFNAQAMLFGTAGRHDSSDLIFILTVLALPILLIGLWTSTAKTVFQTAAYLHSQGKPTGLFNAQFIETSFEQKS